MKSYRLKKREMDYRIKTKDNGDIYNYDPITGFDTTLYESEFADVPIFESPSLNQRLEDTLEEKINNNPR